MMWWDGGFGTGSWIAMMLMMFFGLLLTVGIVLLVVWAVMSVGRGGGFGGAGGQGGGWSGDGALEEARRRFARGEISREEYEEIERVLRR